MPCSELFSHPDRLLEKHLVGTKRLMFLFLQEKKRQFNIPVQFELTMNIIALTHDIGKATNFFQSYLMEKDEKRKLALRSKPETHHASFSALCTFYAVKNALKNDCIEPDLFHFLSYLSVKHHHADLDDPLNESLNESDMQILKRQLDSIDPARWAGLTGELQKHGLVKNISVNQVSEWIDSFGKDWRAFRKIVRKSTTSDLYLSLNFMQSLLVDADRSDVVIKEESHFSRQIPDIPSQVTDLWKKSKKFIHTRLSSLKEEAYNEACHNLSCSNKIFSLTLPTGLGKTAAAFNFAIRMRNKLAATGKRPPRIIYALPFLSIIDQNADVFDEIISFSRLNLDSSLLLKHHHLSEMLYRDNGKEYSSDQSKIMIEGWNSEIIVTTFFQLFHAILTNKNSELRKYHRVIGSIIIIDEVQALPVKYWNLFQSILLKLSEDYNCRLIMVTATQPFIFRESEYLDLVQSGKYFKSVDRINVSYDPASLSLDEFSQKITIDNCRRYLFILNTVASAKKLYELLKKKPLCTPDEMCFLSTHVTAHERLNRINLMKDKSKKIRIVVTTQLVEAGVDIDFDVVYRDFSPFDSINQSAGRCNRNWNNEKGYVYVINLVDDSGKSFADMIYDPVLLDVTKKLLSKNNCFNESDFHVLTGSYFEELAERMSKMEALELLSAVSRMKYDSNDESIAISSFCLINEQYQKIDIFVSCCPEAQSVWNNFEEIGNIDNLFDRKEAFDKIKADFYRFVISIPQKLCLCNPPPEFNEFLRFVNHDQLHEFYDMETGFTSESRDAIW